jgi:hypothetical protein
VSIVGKVMKGEGGASEGLRGMLIGLPGARGAVRDGAIDFRRSWPLVWKVGEELHCNTRIEA